VRRVLDDVMPNAPLTRVVVAGGGVAGLEALAALHALTRHRVEVTLVAPDEAFEIRALSVQEPFARPAPRRYDLAALCADQDATFVQDAVAAVDGPAKTVTTGSGRVLPYDALVVATGARPVPALDGATTFRGGQDAEAIHGIVQDVEGGYSTRLAFVVPSATTWPLPLYELALMTAERASSMGMEVQLTLVTPEERPLAIFGPAASDAVDASLTRAGIVLVTATHVRAVDHGKVLSALGRVVADAQRVVALPRLTAQPIEGLPVDADGFVRIDEQGRVPGLDGVYAAGDGTTFPVKQGGIAAQLADIAVREIAEHAGAAVLPQPFRPVLRAQLLTGTGATYLRQALTGGQGDLASTASDESLWWPPSKVAAPYLTRLLEEVDGRRAGARA
jgi:sulfide:quinone oxidoreductase